MEDDQNESATLPSADEGNTPLPGLLTTLRHEYGIGLPAVLILVATLLGMAAYTLWPRGHGFATDETICFPYNPLENYASHMGVAVFKLRSSATPPRLEDLIFESAAAIATHPLTPEQMTRAVSTQLGPNPSYDNTIANFITTATAEWTVNAETQIQGIGTDSINDSSGNDIVAFLHNPKDYACQKMNEDAGIPAPLPRLTAPAPALYKKHMDRAHIFPRTAGFMLGGPLSGKHHGCFIDTHTGHPVFYKVIVER